MCGRFNVTSKLVPMVSDVFGIPFKVISNTNFSPSQIASTITAAEQGYQQINASWGIKPNWSKKLIINAQSETVAIKPTFKQSFQHQRCLVPCNGWFEWRTEAGKKVKYYFEHADKKPLYMAGILFKGDLSELVTLTTKPNKTCAEYHKRMPVLIEPENIEYWFNADVNKLEPLFNNVNEEMINVKT